MLAVRFFAVAIFTLLFSGSAWAVGVGQPAPDFPFLQTWNLDTGKQRLADFRGSVVLLEVWATW